MKLNQGLVGAAIDLLITRFPDGYGGAAAVYTQSGRVLTSIGFSSPHDSVGLCYETGAFCEAWKLNEKVTACVCVARDSKNSPINILPPCGVCRERLMTWGKEVEVAVPLPEDTTKWTAKSLGEIYPYYWFEVWSKP